MSLINNMLQGLEKDNFRHVAFEDEESRFSLVKLKGLMKYQAGWMPFMVIGMLVLIMGLFRFGFIENNEQHFAIGFKKQVIAQATEQAAEQVLALQQQEVAPQVMSTPKTPEKVVVQHMVKTTAHPIAEATHVMPVAEQTQTMQPNLQSERYEMPVSQNQAQMMDGSPVVDNSPLALSLRELEVSNSPESQTDMSRLLAISYVHMNRIDDAINILSNTLPEIKSDPEHYALLAALYQRSSQHQKAIDIYWRLVEYFPQSGKWWAGLAISLEAVGEKRDALEGYKHARLYKDLSTPLAQYVAHRIKVLKRYS